MLFFFCKLLQACSQVLNYLSNNMPLKCTQSVDLSSHCSNPLLLKGFWKDILFHLLFTSTFPLFPLQVFCLPACYVYFVEIAAGKPQLYLCVLSVTFFLTIPLKIPNFCILSPVPFAQCRCFVLWAFPLLEKYFLTGQTPLDDPS